MSTPGRSELPYFVTSTKFVFCGIKNAPKYLVLYPAKSVPPEYLLESLSISEDPPPNRLAEPTR